MSWAKLAAGGWLQTAAGLSLPADHWGQVDFWIPASTLTACDGDLRGQSAFLLGTTRGSLSDAALAVAAGLADVAAPAGDWRVQGIAGAFSTSSPSTDATHTLKYHYLGGVVDWYLDGVLLFAEVVAPLSFDGLLRLGSNPERCGCEVYYLTDVLVGTTDGGGDIFSDSFSDLSSWVVRGDAGGAVVLVSAPGGPCPRISLSLPSGGPEQLVTLTGSGFAANSTLELVFGGIPIDFSEATSDSVGSVSGTFRVPRLRATSLGAPYDVFLSDAEANVGVAEFTMCWDKAGDGVNTVPDPILQSAGLNQNDNHVLGYIHHDGAHWIAWANGELDGSIFPPPDPAPTLFLTMVTDDGAVVVDYPIETEPEFTFAYPSNARTFKAQHSAFCGSPPTLHVSEIIWSSIFWFDSWSKPVLDLKLASDGTTLWVFVLTRETVAYPYLNEFPFIDLAALTVDYTIFATTRDDAYKNDIRRSIGTPDDFCYPSAYPVSDGGDSFSGNWSPPRVVAFAGDSGGFERIGTMDAEFCPGHIDGGDDPCVPVRLGQAGTGAIVGAFYSGLSVAASDAEPGVCHLVWSEGGNWGPCGLAGTDPGGCPKALVWDGGPLNRDYRVGYSRWAAAGKISETDLFSSHQDRHEWFFEYDYGDGSGPIENGFSWPLEVAATALHAVRNEHGSPVLFIAWPNVLQNPPNVNTTEDGVGPLPADPDGFPFLDVALVNARPKVEMYDLSSGGAVLIQATTSDLLPTEAETEFLYPQGDPPMAADALIGGIAGYHSHPVIDRAFAVSLLYDDPLLAGHPVYLLHVPWGKLFAPDGSIGAFPTRTFLRVPADGSAPFDFLDGTRQIDFTVLENLDNAGVVSPSGPHFGSSDFYSDPDNIWCPNSFFFIRSFGGVTGLQFDRKCINEWLPYTLVPGGGGFSVPGWWSGGLGFHHDPAGDSIAYAAFPDPSLFFPGGDLFRVAVLPLCRNCAPCNCGQGLHVWKHF